MDLAVNTWPRSGDYNSNVRTAKQLTKKAG